MKNTKKRKRISKKSVFSTICFLLIIAIIAVFYFKYPDKFNSIFNNSPSNSASNSKTSAKVVESAMEGDLKIHMVDVGQGDAIIIELPNGQNMLVDAGKDDGDNDVEKDNALTDYIDALNIEKFDYLIGTHQDEDHIGEMETVFYNYDVNYVYRPFVLYKQTASDIEKNGDRASIFPTGFNAGLVSGGKVSTTYAYFNFLKYLQDEKCEWEFFNKDSDLVLNMTSDDKTYTCSFDFLTPTAEKNAIGYSDANSYSPLIMLEYCGKKVMLTGDADIEVEDEFLNYYKNDLANFDVDVLKVGHHGSNTSSSQKFLNTIKPEYALISCGTDNSYGHPHKETLDKFVSANTSIYRTDLQGDVVATITKDGSLTITTEKTVETSSLFVAPQRSVA